ncbi:MAG: glucosaminidase domain-containing protein [Armatimonas sp.]
MRRIVASFAAALLCAGLAAAQTDPIRVEHFPEGKPFGPYKGSVRFTVGRGTKRPVRGAKVTFRILQEDKTVFEKAITEVPSDVVVDTASLEAGEYRVSLVRIDGPTEEPLDEFVVEVGASETVKPTPTPPPPPPVAPEPAAPVAPALRFVTKHTDATRPPVSGQLRIPVNGIPTLTGDVFPAVEVWKDGKLLARNGEISQRPNAFFWDTRTAADGEYTLKLVALDLASDRQTETDTLKLVVKNPHRIVPPPTAIPPGVSPPPPSVSPGMSGIVVPPPPRWRGGRSGPGLTLSGTDARLLGTNVDKFNLIVTLSRLAGDPHPHVAGAQWALESSWGKTVSGRNNYFGIKARPDELGTSKSTTEFYGGAPATEIARFADYNSVFECLQARLKFLRKERYTAYWKSKTDEEACAALQNAGYATDPNYSAKLIDILGRMAKSR